MKKLFLALFCVFFMVSCGSDSPDDVVKNYYEALFKGDLKKTSQYVETAGEDMDIIQEYLQETSHEFLNKTNKQGGFKDVEIINSTINKDRATVRFQMNFKSGQSKSEEITLSQKNGKWYLPKIGYEIFVYKVERHLIDIAKDSLEYLIFNLTDYYLTKNKLANDLKEMIKDEYINDKVYKNGEFYVYKYPCLKMSIKDNALVITNNNKDNNRFCTSFMEDKKVIKILKGVNLNKKQSTAIKIGS